MTAHLLQPFRGLRCATGRAGDVIAPPYDVLTSDEARQRAEGKPWSFLHVSKPEIDLPPGADPYSERVYSTGASNLVRMIREGVLVREEKPTYYVYRVVAGDHVQTGVAGVGALEHYASNRIRRHELTTPEKEDDRVRHMEALNAQTGPVMAAYPDAPEIDDIVAGIAKAAPDAEGAISDGTRHTLWVVRDPALVERLTRAFDALPCIYIADGHHRSAAAARVAAARRSAGATIGSEASWEYFLTVVFPVRQMRILDYNRMVVDLKGLTGKTFVQRVKDRFHVETVPSAVRPSGPREFGLFTAGQWYRLRIRPDLVPDKDPLGRLDVRLLSDFLLEPVLGIKDNGRDKRLAYVGGSRGLDELERRVRSGEMAAAISLFPTQMADTMAVADAGGVMPPKSTWFAPKLVDGLISHVLD